MKRNRLFLKTLFFSFILFIILVSGFKKIRALFPPPEIGSDKLIGFSQYFGYPFYFDNLFFFFLIFFPVVVFLFFLYIKKK
ncbi:hypothetical protein M1146_00585 [Patescibacteria group bacterium]|nr:hypothetical protein [Patescibacteria group bacterium]